jgi:hypothetical protein
MTVVIQASMADIPSEDEFFSLAAKELNPAHPATSVTCSLYDAARKHAAECRAVLESCSIEIDWPNGIDAGAKQTLRAQIEFQLCKMKLTVYRAQRVAILRTASDAAPLAIAGLGQAIKNRKKEDKGLRRFLR